MAGVLRPRPRSTPLVDIVSALQESQGSVFLGGADVDGVMTTGIAHDSRGVQPGDLYAALPGRNTHGATFARDAQAKGAVAVLTDESGWQLIESDGGLAVPVLVVAKPRNALGHVSARIFGFPAESLLMLGVTGTNGKTTVATMVAEGLRAAGHVVGVIGTVGVRVGDEVLAGVRTTPEAPDLHALLAYMVERGVSAVSMEVSSIAIVEHRVDGLVLDVAGFTNLSQDHLDYHGTMEAYLQAKAQLFTPERARRGVIGIDDDAGRLIAAEASVPIQTWSLLDPAADWHAERLDARTNVVDRTGVQTQLDIRLPGAFNVSNGICAFAMLRAAGIDAEAASAGIALAVVPGRMQVVGEGEVVGIVDYAHSPDAIDRVLKAIRDTYRGRVIAVLGAGGDRDTAKRPLMGACAAEAADHVVITDDNPRSEDPARIRAALLEGAARVTPARRATIEEVGDRRTAITVAVQGARPGDVVVVLGKGHEQGQEVGGVVTAFDDVVELRTALDGRAPR